VRIDLDVSELVPCEPLERITEQLRRLETGNWLHVIHRQEPHPLYQLLAQGGFAWHTSPGGPAGYVILIWRKGDTPAEREALKAAQ
jgi:uncharacterized protein (DUF2249 family)